MRWLKSITNSMDMNLSRLGIVKERGLVGYNPWTGKESGMT